MCLLHGKVQLIMEEIKKIDKRESLRVVTSNNFITAQGLDKLSLNARKLLYIAIAQCEMKDTEFYEYETTPMELAQMWGIDPSNVYEAASKIADELLSIIITEASEEKKRF